MKQRKEGRATKENDTWLDMLSYIPQSLARTASPSTRVRGGAGFLRNWGSLSEVLVTRGVFLSSGSYNKNPSAMGSLTPL